MNVIVLDNTYLQTNDARISLSHFCNDLSGVKVISSLYEYVPQAFNNREVFQYTSVKLYLLWNVIAYIML